MKCFLQQPAGVASRKFSLHSFADPGFFASATYAQNDKEYRYLSHSERSEKSRSFGEKMYLIGGHQAYLLAVFFDVQLPQTGTAAA